jgi:hypothetical protein
MLPSRLHAVALTALAIVALLPAAPAAHAVPINLSTGKPVTASSELAACCGSATPFFASRAVDGSRDGSDNNFIFHTNAPETNVPSFFEVDLGSNKVLDRVQIFPRTNAVQNSVENFRLDVFNAANALVYSDTFLATDSTRDVVWGTSEVRNVVGQRVRITRLDQAPSNFMTFAEFEVWGQDTKIEPNIALLGTATASGPAGFGATNNDAIDGDINGHFFVPDSLSVGGPGPVYHNNSTAAGEFWQLDLGSERDLDYVLLYSRTDFRGNSPSARLDILAADGVTVVHTQSVTWFNIELGTFRFDQTIDLTGVKGQYLRLTNTTGGGNNFLTFAEVEVFANAIPEPANAALLGLASLAMLRRRNRRWARR